MTYAGDLGELVESHVNMFKQLVKKIGDFKI